MFPFSEEKIKWDDYGQIIKYVIIILKLLFVMFSSSVRNALVTIRTWMNIILELLRNAKRSCHYMYFSCTASFFCGGDRPEQCCLLWSVLLD